MRKLYVSNKDETIRMFKSNFFEAFSKVHFSVPLIIYLPVIGYFLYLSFVSSSLTLLSGLAYFGLGLLIWTVTEYILHRYIFHFEPKGKIGQRLHFIFHGVHHDYPNDSLRLVMPPSVSIPLAFLFYFSFRSILPGDALYPFFAAFVLGYLAYDMLHYAIHHVNMKGKWWVALKTHHLKHHFKDPDKGYGVSSPLWDVIVGSNFKKGSEKAAPKKRALETSESSH